MQQITETNGKISFNMPPHSDEYGGIHVYGNGGTYDISKYANIKPGFRVCIGYLGVATVKGKELDHVVRYKEHSDWIIEYKFPMLTVKKENT